MNETDATQCTPDFFPDSRTEAAHPKENGDAPQALPAQLSQAEYDARLRALQRREAQCDRRDRQRDVERRLTARGLSERFAPFLTGETQADSLQRVDDFEALYRAELRAPPPPPHGPAPPPPQPPPPPGGGAAPAGADPSHRVRPRNPAPHERAGNQRPLGRNSIDMERMI